jgi:hypothetical protein
MTHNQLSLLKSLAMGKIAELRMGVQSIDEALKNPRIPEHEKAFLTMQRGGLKAALDDLEQNYALVEQEDPGVIQT